MVRADRIGGWAIDRAKPRRGGGGGHLPRGPPHRHAARGPAAQGPGAGRRGGGEPRLRARARPAAGAGVRVHHRRRRPGRGGLRRAAPRRRRARRRRRSGGSSSGSSRRWRGSRQQPPAAADPAEALQRLELAQARIEAALAGLEAPAPPPPRGLWALALAALAIGAGSLVLGIVSMLGPERRDGPRAAHPLHPRQLPGAVRRARPTGSPGRGWEVSLRDGGARGRRRDRCASSATRRTASPRPRPTPTPRRWTGRRSTPRASCASALAARRDGYRPDIIVAHSGWGAGMFAKDVFPEAAFVAYCEWWYRYPAADVAYLAAAGGRARRNRRSRRRCTSGRATRRSPWTSPPRTRRSARREFQASQFPGVFRRHLSVMHDGIDTEFFRPSAAARRSTLGGLVAEDARVVTYATRGMEPHRGFPQFMAALPAVLARRSEGGRGDRGGEPGGVRRGRRSGAWTGRRGRWRRTTSTRRGCISSGTWGAGDYLRAAAALLRARLSHGSVRAVVVDAGGDEHRLRARALRHRPGARVRGRRHSAAMVDLADPRTISDAVADLMSLPPEASQRIRVRERVRQTVSARGNIGGRKGSSRGCCRRADWRGAVLSAGTRDLARRIWASRAPRHVNSTVGRPLPRGQAGSTRFAGDAITLTAIASQLIARTCSPAGALPRLHSTDAFDKTLVPCGAILSFARATSWRRACASAGSATEQPSSPCRVEAPAHLHPGRRRPPTRGHAALALAAGDAGVRRSDRPSARSNP